MAIASTRISISNCFESKQIPFSSYHISHIPNNESDSGVDDEFPNAMLFVVDAVPEYLSTNKIPTDLTKAQQKRLIIRASSFTIIGGMLYKLCHDEVLRCCVMPHEVHTLIQSFTMKHVVDTLLG